MELIEKLRAALDDEEQLAQEAAVAPPIQFFLARQVGKEASSRFLHAHTPTRVLRQVAAMRKILDEHPVSAYPPYDCIVCGDSIRDVETLPCPTLLALAEAMGIE